MIEPEFSLGDEVRITVAWQPDKVFTITSVVWDEEGCRYFLEGVAGMFTAGQLMPTYRSGEPPRFPPRGSNEWYTVVERRLALVMKRCGEA